MLERKTVILVAIVLVALVAAPGCVTKKLFRKNVESTDARVTDVETAVEENERRIEELGTSTDSKINALESKTQKAVELGSAASNKADAAASTAEKALRGRLLWEVTLTDQEVRFGFGEATLSDGAMQKLDEIAAKVKSMDKAVYIEIQGHTDNIGGEAYNMQLGHERAMAALRYLADQGGIPLHALNAISYGESQPIADNGTKDGRSVNRRVVVRVLE